MKTIEYFENFARVLDNRAWTMDTAPWAKWAWEIVRQEIGEAENAFIVDLGTGTGVNIAYLIPYTKNARFLGVDFSPEMVKVAREKFSATDHTNVEFVQSRLDTMKMENNSVNYFISAGTFHHIKNKKKVFSLLLKALKPGGKFINVDHCKGREDYQKEFRRLREENPEAAKEDDEAFEKIKWIYEQDLNHPIEFHTDPYEFKDLLISSGFDKADVHVSFHQNYTVIVGEKSK
jgi:ubiquinone/menaquinone biosynthesis C-methylase UbiE